VLWHQAVHTDREVTANRPDIIMKNKKEKTCTLIDVAIPADRNVVQKEAEKKLKYKSFCIAIQRMWNLKCTIVPVIIGATGIVMRSLTLQHGVMSTVRHRVNINCHGVTSTVHHAACRHSFVYISTT